LTSYELEINGGYLILAHTVECMRYDKTDCRVTNGRWNID